MTSNDARRLNELAERVRTIAECDDSAVIWTTITRIWGLPAVELCWILRDRAFAVAVGIRGCLRLTYRIGLSARVSFRPPRDPYNAIRFGHEWLRSGDGLDAIADANPLEERGS